MRLYRALRSETSLSGVPHAEYWQYPEPGVIAAASHKILLRLEKVEVTEVVESCGEAHHT